MDKDRKAGSAAAERRAFLKLAGLGGVAAGAAALVGGGDGRAEAAAPTEEGTGGRTGYRETEHVRRFYELARF